VRGILLFIAMASLGCAGKTGEGTYRPEGPMGGLAERGSEMAFSRTRFPLRLGYREALQRFQSIIGRPDRRNQIHVARDRIVTYGFQFREATLLIRCRADVVEVARTVESRAR
jgi:hypothetical protein